MKPMRELNHYELLELPKEAPPDEIERAYALVREAYAPGSLASYSVFDEQEAAAVRQQVETAYTILSDPDRREAYNASLVGGSVLAGEELIVVEPYDDGGVDASKQKPHGALDDFDDVDPDAPWDGARLRRARLARGAEIDSIAAVTKVNPAYLRCIEGDDFEALPAPVYVRGFVDAYARFLDLDARTVASSYVERVKERLENTPRGQRLKRG